MIKNVFTVPVTRWLLQRCTEDSDLLAFEVGSPDNRNPTFPDNVVSLNIRKIRCLQTYGPDYPVTQAHGSEELYLTFNS